MDHYYTRIVTDPEICGGRPGIRGTLMRASDVVDHLTVGETRAVILEDHPCLVDENISAALHYAAATTAHRLIAAE